MEILGHLSGNLAEIGQRAHTGSHLLVIHVGGCKAQVAVGFHQILTRAFAEPETGGDKAQQEVALLHVHPPFDIQLGIVGLHPSLVYRGHADGPLYERVDHLCQRVGAAPRRLGSPRTPEGKQAHHRQPYSNCTRHAFTS